MKTTLSAALALAAFAGSTLAQAGGPLWDRRLEATDVQLVCDASGQTFIQISPFVSNFSSSTIDIGTVAEVFINGAPVTAELGSAVLPPASTVGTCVDLICYWPCLSQDTQCRFFPYNGRCTCFVPTERVLPPMPVTVREGDVVTVQLSAAPGAVPEVYPDGDSVSFVARFPSGILHTPIGTATLGATVGRRLPISNLGSSGQDGVEIKFRTASGGSVDVDMSHHFGPSNVGHSLRTRYKGWDGTIKGRYTATATFSDGVNQDVSEECDFSPLGPVHVEMTCVSSTGVVTVLPIRESPTLAWTSQCALNPGTQPTWTLGKGDKASMQLWLKRSATPSTVHVPTGTGGVITVPDVVEILCRPICIVAPCPGDWGNLGSMMIMSDTPELDVSDATLREKICMECLSWGANNAGTYATGAATVSETQFDITGDGAPDTVYRTRCPNLGSSGQDGVEVQWPPATTGARERWGNGHVTLMKVFDDTTGAESRLTVSKDPLVPGRTTFSPDDSAMGTTQTLVTAYDGSNNPIATFILAIGGVAVLDEGALCPPGSYPTWAYIGNKKFFTGCQYYMDFTIPGGPSIPNVHSVSFEPLNPTTNMDFISRVGLYTNDGEDIVRGAIEIIPDGPACDSTDFNQDGLFPDTMDIDDFLSVFSGGLCSDGTMCNTDTDFNNDGLFPDTMDIDSLLSVFSGGPCI
ncbi:MAG TPA: hypothetical protein VHN77_02115 [Phycisphaerales bacterium]|nr:hypothetical protein [Phycisphaerales bacterium]